MKMWGLGLWPRLVYVATASEKSIAHVFYLEDGADTYFRIDGNNLQNYDEWKPGRPQPTFEVYARFLKVLF